MCQPYHHHVKSIRFFHQAKGNLKPWKIENTIFFLFDNCFCKSNIELPPIVSRVYVSFCYTGPKESHKNASQ